MHEGVNKVDKGISLLVGLTAMFAMGSAGASSCPTLPVESDINPETGHFFEVYAADGITWDAAKACADGKSSSGVPGHLATITSSSEDEWVDGLRNTSGLGQVWIGGSQQGSPTAPGVGWRLENSEGPIPGANNETAYANWADGEPNDGGADLIENGQEEHLTLGRFGLGAGWNDEGTAPDSIGGFIVEYDVPRTAECTVGEGCETIKGHTLTFPAGWVDPGDTITFTAFEFTDLRVGANLCGQDELILFGDANDGKPELRIPPYLCGSPKFVVIAVDGSDLSFGQGGTVLIENDTATVLPDNDIKDCKDTKGPLFPDLDEDPEDPQYQDVVVYQTTDPARMLEDSNGTGKFAGAAGEFTSSCGSSRGRAKEPSYFVVGMHIDFGVGFELEINAPANHQSFVELTLYKLSLLQQSVFLAKSAGALKNGDATKMTAQLDNAVKKLGRGDPSGALGHVNKFLKFVAAANYTQLGLDNNYNGEHLMRGTNIEFTLRVKVVPYAP